VFEPFERGQGANVRAIPGTGLGLTITKLLTQIMGGEINASSQVGVGTRFTVRLLLSEAAPAPSAAGARAITGYVGARRRLLLIDDDPAHLDIVQNLLRPLDFALFTAPDGLRGLALAEECEPDLAMIDISMPGMNGWQVAERLRARSRPTKIVIVSANAHEFSPGGAEFNHDAFLNKPIDVQRMLECLAVQLDLQWTHAAAVPEPEPSGADASDTLPAHSRHHVDDLYQLGLIGHVRGIQAKLRELEGDPQSKAFATRMRALVTNFDLKRYMNVLEGMRKHG
jgi:CheY-like chemotaxis protein